MRIDSIALKSIRSHKETELAFERFTILRGINHAGKSSVLQAIEFALARRADSTDGSKERQQTDLLRFGEDQGLIELGIDLDGVPVELRASLTKRSGLNITLRNPKDKEWNPVQFKQELEDDRDVLSCLCNNHYFVELKPADQKNLLASIILPARHDWPEKIKTDLHESRISLDWSLHPFELIEAGYDAAFKARTDVNRKIKEWHPPAANGEYSGPPAAEIQGKLRQRQDERTNIAVEQRGLQAAIEQARQQKAGHERRAQEAANRIATEQKEREGVAGNALSAAAVKKAEKEAAGAKKATDLDAEWSTLSAELNQVKKQIAAFSDLEAYAECPTCRQQITDEVFQKIAAPSLKRQDEILTRQREVKEERDKLGDPAGAQKKLDAHKGVEDDLKRIDRRISDLERSAKAAKSEADAIDPDALPKPDSLNEKLADLDQRIRNGTDALQLAAKADQAKDETVKANAAKKALDEQLARLERLVTYFGPKGVKAELIAQHIGGFQSGVNAVLEKWGYECQLQIEPYGFQVKRLMSPHAAQLHQLSRSEKLRFSNAFTVALAMVSGWKFAIFDDTEAIVGQDRAEFKGLLYGSALDQAIVIEADTNANAAPLAGSTFIKLSEQMENGIGTTVVEVLGRKAAKRD